ncbi:hypothetical protein [Cytophaga sp. FL35]|uniref:hypothetical protein n=1 Tax=Cytophaga sp. FL35 TaxID=1904456 RepID=UPI001653A06C|nr:hypothetical protein [Cytophaga sp. FL35]MBC6999464.1 hypothetical protein [Cytophaga sp. FL35]
MKKILFVTVLGLAISCGNVTHSHINFVITNETAEAIQDLKFYTSEKVDTVVIEMLEERNALSGKLTMDHNRTDGHYIFEFKRENGQPVTLNHGYYTNGQPQENKILYTIQSDTVLVKFE